MNLRSFVLWLLAGAIVATGCTGEEDAREESTTTASTTTSIVPPGPRTPCATAEEAARAVEAAWGADDVTAALRCGTEEAVERLFAASTGDAALRSFQSCVPAAPGSPVATCRFVEPGRGIDVDVEPVRDGGYYVTAVRIGSASELGG